MRNTIEDMILDLLDNQDDMTRSDLQGVVSVTAQKILDMAKEDVVKNYKSEPVVVFKKKKVIVNLYDAMDEFVDMIKEDILNNYYVKFEEWLADEGYYLEEWEAADQEEKMKDDYLKS